MIKAIIQGIAGWLVLLPLSVSLAQLPPENTRHLEYFVQDFPAEKVFLHLDKDYYLAGDIIWFKSYVFDGVTHSLRSGKQNVYVELLNRQGNLLKRKILQAEDGLAWADFKLSDSIPDGNYLIRAYTNPMRNLDEPYFFQRQIYISNPEFKNYIRWRELWANRLFNRRLDRKTQRFDLDFHVEGGGDLILGLPTRLVFHATDDLGRGVGLTGEIRNSRGAEVASISDRHGGYGSMEFTPTDPRGYEAEVVFEGTERSRRFRLPPAREEGLSMGVDADADTLRLAVRRSSGEATQAHDPLMLLAHTRGMLSFQKEVLFEDHAFEARIPRTALEPGVTEFLLLSGNKQSLASRLVYVEKAEAPAMRMQRLTASQGRVRAEISLGEDGLPWQDAHYSVSVTGVTDVMYDMYTDMSLYLLIDSEFGQRQESLPLLRTRPSDLDAEVIDLLMLTRRWDRFQLSDVLAGSMPASPHGPSLGMFLEGQVIHPANDQPLTEYPVKLILKDGELEVFDTLTDSEGQFIFPGLQFHEQRTVELSSSRLPEGYFPRMNISAGREHPAAFEVSYQTRPQQVTRRGDDWTRTRRRDIRPYQVPSYYHPSPSIYGEPSQTIFVSERDEDYKSMLEVLTQRGTGVYVRSGRLHLRGSSSVMIPGDPLFMIDGVRVNRSTFLSTRVMDVHRIEIFKGANTAVFGVEGTHGAIIAYTKRGGMVGRDGYEFLMSGFAVPRRFEYNAPPAPIPDDLYRSTLYWNPRLRINHRGLGVFFFDASDAYDHYLVVIEGIDPQGRIESRRFLISAP